MPFKDYLEKWNIKAKEMSNAGTTYSDWHFAVQAMLDDLEKKVDFILENVAQNPEDGLPEGYSKITLKDLFAEK